MTHTANNNQHKGNNHDGSNGSSLLVNAYTITTAFICIALMALSFTTGDASKTTVLSYGHSLYLSILSVLVFVAARYLLMADKKKQQQQGSKQKNSISNTKHHHKRDAAQFIGRASAEEDYEEQEEQQSLSQKLRQNHLKSNNRTGGLQDYDDDDSNEDEARLQLHVHSAHCQQIEDLLVSDHDSSSSCFVYATSSNSNDQQQQNTAKLISTTITSQQQQQKTLKECVGVHTEKGRRGYMEDAVAIYEDQNYSLYSVFDGHGGRVSVVDFFF